MTTLTPLPTGLPLEQVPCLHIQMDDGDVELRTAAQGRHGTGQGTAFNKATPQSAWTTRGGHHIFCLV